MATKRKTKKPSERKFYVTVFKVTVMTTKRVDTRSSDVGLADLVEGIYDGSRPGEVITEDVSTLNEGSARLLLNLLGSPPDRLGLSENTE